MHSCFNLLAPVAEDFVCAPASQAVVELIISVCGIMSNGQRSSMHKSGKAYLSEAEC